MSVLRAGSARDKYMPPAQHACTSAQFPALLKGLWQIRERVCERATAASPSAKCSPRLHQKNEVVEETSERVGDKLSEK